MGIITKEVEINTQSMHKEIKDRYVSLGYEPYKYKSILVKVEDISKGSKIKIKVECDVCKNKYDIVYSDYLKGNHDGKTYCKHCALGVLNSKENHPLYNFNKTDEERELNRHIENYDIFTKGVLKRDNYKCQCCGSHTQNLKVHHLDGYNWCKEKRTDISNGITLCENCHKNFHFQHGYGNNTKIQFEEWIGRKLDNLEFEYVVPEERKIYCFEEDKIYSIDEFCKSKNITRTRLVSACNVNNKHHNVKGFHIAYFDVYKNMTKEEIEDYCPCNKTKSKVVCVETEEIFSSITDACKKYNINSKSSISLSCITKKRKAGNFHWLYLKDYETMSDEEKDKLKNIKRKDYKKIICIETKEIFESIVSASNTYNIEKTSISSCCRKLSSTAGGYHWMYYDEYSKISNDDVDNYIRKNKRYRKIRCVETNEIFNSVKEACDKYQTKRIYVCLIGIQKTCKNYHWEYCDD